MKKNILLIVLYIIPFICINAEEINFQQGDIVRYNSNEFYVIKVNDDYLTLFKNEPITSEEARRIMSSTEIYNQLNYSEEYLYSSYMYSDTCKSAGNITSGCSNDYNISTVKQVVDAWGADSFKSNDLVLDNFGYKYRLINFEELANVLYFDNFSWDMNHAGYHSTTNTPSWIYKYNTWTMAGTENITNIYCIRDSGELYSSLAYLEYSIQPVANVKKNSVELITKRNVIDRGKLKLGEKYETGDIVNYKGIKFYVLRNSGSKDEYVTLLKATPLSIEEVDKYGKDIINRFTQKSINKAYDSRGFGGMAYYSEGNCEFKNRYPNESGCITSYDKSDIKKVVDNWTHDLFTDEDLGEDEYGYRSRILNKDDLFNHLNYVSSNKEITSGGEYIKYTENTPNFNLSSCWTMVEVQDYNQYLSIRGADGNFYIEPVYNYTGTVCPVLTIKKQHIEEDNNSNSNSNNNESSKEVKVPDTRLNNLIVYIVIGIVIIVSSIVIIGYKFKNNKNR